MPPTIYARQPPNNAWVAFDLATISTIYVRQPPSNQWAAFTIGNPAGWLPGPTDIGQIFVGIAPSTGTWQYNPAFIESAAGLLRAHVLPAALVDQNRAYGIGGVFNYDIALNASTENGFSVVIDTNDTIRRVLRFFLDARRVGGAGTSGVTLIPVLPDPAWAVAAVANGNNVRITLTNNSGAVATVSIYADPFTRPNA